MQGNLIGTDPTGTFAVPNSTGMFGGEGSVIGGTEPGAGNLISGNQNSGAVIQDNSRVQGNLIGTDREGINALGNGGNGLTIRGDGNLIGGTEGGAGNVISANEDGIAVPDIARENVIQGNFIGTQVDGISPLGNTAAGIDLSNDEVTETLIGGLEPGAGNLIAFNSGDGVRLHEPDEGVNPSSFGNSVLSNSIFGNEELGIDWNGDEVTSNDPDDADDGPNHLQNFPIITSAAHNGEFTLVEGTLDSTPETEFTLQFFLNEEADPSGHGEGETLLNATNVTTDGDGDAEFGVLFAEKLPLGQFVVATATDSAGNTSEFSEAAAITDEPPQPEPTDGTYFNQSRFSTLSVPAPAEDEEPNEPPSADAGGPYTIDEGDSLTLDASNSSDPDNDPLSFTWDVDNDGTFGDATGERPTLAWDELRALGIDDDGTFSVTVRVDDGNDHTDEASTELAANNTAPTLAISGPPETEVGETYTLTLGEVIDPGEDTLNEIHVDWGDGSVESFSSPGDKTHVYDVPGDMMIAVDLLDEDGTFRAGTLDVTVNEQTEEPILTPPSQPDLLPESDTGFFDDDDITSDRTPTVQTTAPAGRTVRFQVNGATVATATEVQAGVYRATLPEGSLHFGINRVRATPGGPQGASSPSEPLALRMLVDDFLVVPGAEGRPVRFVWTVEQAGFENEIGLFLVDDDAGRVDGLDPGNPGYAQAGLRSPGRQVIFEHGEEDGARRELVFEGGDRVVPFLIQNDTTAEFLQENPENRPGEAPNAFFAIEQANPDGFDHARFQSPSPGVGEFAWEDLTGGGDADFDDAVTEISILPNLSGVWTDNGVANSARIEQDGSSLKLVNRRGVESEGRLLGRTEVVAWDGLHGEIEDDGTRILWDNGVVWELGSRPDLSGTWTDNGFADSAQITQTDSDLTLVNRRDVESEGRFLSPTEIVAWNGLHGHIENGGDRILWDNGAIWQKSNPQETADLDAAFAELGSSTELSAL